MPMFIPKQITKSQEKRNSNGSEERAIQNPIQQKMIDQLLTEVKYIHAISF